MTDSNDKPKFEKLTAFGPVQSASHERPAARFQPVKIGTAVRANEVEGMMALTDSRLFFNRELSWLDFNWRVLAQALDTRTPLLERVRFVAITANNLDEFVRKRVGGLKRQSAAHVTHLSPDGRTPEQQLALIRRAITELHQQITATWENDLRPTLAGEAGIFIHDHVNLEESEQRWLHSRFLSHIYPILTPLAVDPSHPFPFISNQSLSLAVEMIHPDRGTRHFARLKVPKAEGRWIQLERMRHYVPIEQVIAANVGDLFPGMELVGAYPFRITRNADVQRDEEEADDLIELISDELRERRFASVVRLEVDEKMPNRIRKLLLRELGLGDDDEYSVSGMLDLSDLFEIANANVPEHSFEPWEPVIPPRLQTDELSDTLSIFDAVKQRDILVHHPYESFHASVQKFIEEAASDPNVLAIKQTLYRTSTDSPIIEALMKAAEKGKQVAVLVEVKARFDEENNIEWGQRLEDAGVHVTYGLVGLKTHAKTTLIIRRESGQLRTYCHIGTGNYNAQTARLYTDVGLFTADQQIGSDSVNLFHYLTGFAPRQKYQQLIVAPSAMRKRFIHYVRNEIQHHRVHGNGYIKAKMNALDDVEMITELYRASQEGVRIDLVVRGHCRLRPGLQGYSDNIRVVSILGRFLEHSRIYYFHNNEDPIVIIGSGDWQRRNLDDRVEVAVQVRDEVAKQTLIDILDISINDHRLGWTLNSDGKYTQRMPRKSDDEKGSQQKLMQMALVSKLNRPH